MGKTSPPVKEYIDQIRKKFSNDEIAYSISSHENLKTVDVVPTRISTLDMALGIGGIPRGRIVEIFGPESSGKTTLALHTIAEFQRQGGICHFIDAEHALDLCYATQLGVDIDALIVTQPDHGEQALQVAEFAAENGISLVVVDSVAALSPRSEIEGDIGDPQMGAQARLISQAMRKLSGIAFKNNCTIIFINQLRMKIGVMFGNPETTPGGQALKFYASIRIDIRKGKTLENGQETVIKIIKNKCAPPFKTCHIPLYYGKGFDRIRALVDSAIEKNIIQQKASWFTYAEHRWQGIESVCAYLRDHLDIADTIERALYEVSVV